LHDLRRAPGWRRRGTDPPGTVEAADRSAGARLAQARWNGRGAHAPRPRADARAAALGPTRSRGREHREHLGAVALELRRPDAGDGAQLTEITGLARGNLRQRRVVEDDVSRLRIRCCPLEPPPLQSGVERIVRFGLAPL